MDSPAAYEVAFTDTFFAALLKLSAQHRSVVLEAIDKLQRGVPGVHVHAVPPLPWVSFSAGAKDALRVICHREGAMLLLAHVDIHDAAYRWADRHRPERFRSVIRFRKIAVAEEGETPASVEVDVDAVPGPLAEITDKMFRAFEVSASLAKVLRAVPDDDTFIELCCRLEPRLAEALVSLATDPDDITGIVNRYIDAKKGEEVSLAEAVKAPINAERLWIVPPEQAVVEAALKGDAESWRVFLHPSQKRLIEQKTGGAFLVTGGPGTGKTVVALHRARALVERAHGDSRPVLLTTFSAILAKHLEDGIAAVCRDKPELLKKIEVMTLVGSAQTVLRAANESHSLLVAEDIDAAWDEALRAAPTLLDDEGKKRGRRFFEAEREEVVLPQGITTEAHYLKARRTGRGEKLKNAEKKEILGGARGVRGGAVSARGRRRSGSRAQGNDSDPRKEGGVAVFGGGLR